MILVTSASQLLTAIAEFVNEETSAEIDYVHTDYPDAYVRVEILGQNYLLSIEENDDDD